MWGGYQYGLGVTSWGNEFKNAAPKGGQEPLRNINGRLGDGTGLDLPLLVWAWRPVRRKTKTAA